MVSWLSLMKAVKAQILETVVRLLFCTSTYKQYWEYYSYYKTVCVVYL